MGQKLWEERLVKQSLSKNGGRGDGHSLQFAMRNLYPDNFMEKRVIENTGNTSNTLIINADTRQMARAVVALLQEGATIDGELADLTESAAQESPSEAV